MLAFIVLYLGAAIHGQGYLLGRLYVDDGTASPWWWSLLVTLCALAMPLLAAFPVEVIAQRYNTFHVPQIVSFAFLVLVYWWACPYFSMHDAAHLRAHPDVRFALDGAGPVPVRVELAGAELRADLGGSVSWTRQTGKQRGKSTLHVVPIVPAGANPVSSTVRFWVCSSSPIAASTRALRGTTAAARDDGVHTAGALVREVAARGGFSAHADPQCVTLRSESSAELAARLDQRARWQHGVFNALVLGAMLGARWFLRMQGTLPD